MKLLTKIMKGRGYSNYYAPKLAKYIFDDFFKNNNATIKQKIWAYRKGFLSSSMIRLGLNEKNYTEYMPEFTYYKLHPINGKYNKWIDDKLTIKYLLKPFDCYLPKYYFLLEEKEIIKLPDCPENISSNVEGIVDLLKKEESLAIKQTAGTLGIGFYKLDHINNNFYINNKKTSEEEFFKFISDLNNYTITEYIHSHQFIKNIFSKSANSLRIMMVNDTNKGPQITGAYIKFGTEKSGVIEHVWAGGILAKIDLEDGNITDSYMTKRGKLESIKEHPDTGVKIKGSIPHWKLICDKLIQIVNYIPQLKYMGFDVLVTDEGFKILEINSHQGLDLMQVYYPVLKNDTNNRFFNKLIESKL